MSDKDKEGIIIRRYTPKIVTCGIATLSLTLILVSSGFAISSNVTIDPKTEYQIMGGFGQSHWYGNCIDWYQDISPVIRSEAMDRMWTMQQDDYLGWTTNLNCMEDPLNFFVDENHEYDPIGKKAYMWTDKAAYARGAELEGRFHPLDWHTSGGYLIDGREDELAGDLAYLLKNIQQDFKLDYSYICPMNEADATWFVHISKEQAATIINYLRSALDEQGLTDVMIAADDEFYVNTSNRMSYIVQNTGSNLDVMTGHQYSTSDSVLTTWRNIGNQYGKGVWQTEWGDWDNLDVSEQHAQALNYMKKMFKALSVWKVNMWLAWEHHFLFFIDATNGWVPKESYYTVAQFSRFAEPGWKMISTSDMGSSAGTLAFIETGAGANEASIITFNDTTSSVDVSYDLSAFLNPTVLVIRRTGETERFKSISGSVVGGQLTVAVPAESIISTRIHFGSDTPPAAPGSLSATASNAQVNLDWSDNTEADLDSYNIYRSTTTDKGFEQIASAVASSAYTDNAGLVNGSTCYYVVTAVDTAGNESSYSNEDSATPTGSDTTPPSAPWFLNAMFGNGRVNLIWNDNFESDISHYNVKRATVSGGPYTQIAENLTTTTYTDTGLTNSTIYYYVVTAVDTSSNESGYSEQVPATPEVPQPIYLEQKSSSDCRLRSTGSDVDLASAGTTGAVVEWKFVDASAGYYYIQNEDNGKRLRAVYWDVDLATAGTTGSDVEWEIWHIADNPRKFIVSRSVYRKLHAKESEGWVVNVKGTQWTDGNLQWNPVPVNDIVAPAAPANVTATAGDTTVSLDWVYNTEYDFSHYNVKRSTVPGGPYTQVATNLKESAYTDTGLVNYTTCCYVVTSVDDSGNESDNSTEVSATPQVDTTPPAAPSNLTAAVGVAQVSLNWADNAESDLSHYKVWISTTAGGPYTQTATNVTASVYTDTGLTNGTYYYVATAIDTASNESGYSNEALAVVTEQPVDVTNYSFEEPGTIKQTNWENVPGWSSDIVADDSGVETGYNPTDGGWIGFLKGSDPSVWQLTGHTISAGKIFTLKVDARQTWNGTSLQVSLYYDDSGSRVTAATHTASLSGSMAKVTLSFAADDVPASIGKKIGIEFNNTTGGSTWVGLDNVRLSYGPAPNTDYNEPQVADLNNDGKVNLKDYSKLARYWQQNEPSVDIGPPPCGDQIVDYKDLCILSRNWLKAWTIPPLPEQASNPTPSDGASYIDVNTDLSWTAGTDATSHDVYFGTSEPLPFIGNQTATTFEPGTLAEAAMYYWRIDSVNDWGKTVGHVWSFTTFMPPPP